MRINEFINQELKNIASQELKNLVRFEEEKELIRVLNSISLEDELGNIEEYILVIKSSSILNHLKNFNFILDILLKVYDFEFCEDSFKEIEQNMKNNPKIRIYPLLWIYYKVNFFRNDEYLDSEFADFLKNIFIEYDYLINLDDFLYETNVLIIKPSWEKWMKEIFANVFELASKKYPNKYAFKSILAKIYFQNEEYLLSLSHLAPIIQFVNSVPENKKDKTIIDFEFPYIEYLDAIQLAGIIHHKLGEQNKAMYYVNYVLNNLPIINFNKGEEEEVSMYIDSFFIRMHSNAQKNKNEKVLQDYEKVKGYLSCGDWENKYTDVINYINNRKVA